jgi:hypothetical protein
MSIFRVYRHGPPSGFAIANKSKKPSAKQEIGYWLDRVLKLIPSEVTAIYLAGRGYAKVEIPTIWPVICLLLVFVIRYFGTQPEGGGRPQLGAILISGIAFVIWVYAMGGQFLSFPVGQDLASLAVLVFGAVAPIFYKGASK